MQVESQNRHSKNSSYQKSQKNPVVALIIQGPMISVGRSGATLNICATQANEMHLVRYDCHENVKNIVKTFGHLFEGGIILSTWKGELKEPISELITIESDDSTLCLPDRTGVKNPILKKNNKLRQFYLIHEGLKYLETKNEKIDGVIKIRTDQFLDLYELTNALKHELKKKNSKMLVSYVSHKGTFQDFYFATSFEKMKDFVLTYIENYIEFNEHIHIDVPIRLSLFSKFYKMKVPIWLSKLPLGKDYILSQFSKRYLSPLSKNLFLNTKWRGTLMDDPTGKFFTFDKKKYSYPSLKSFLSSIKILLKKSIKRNR